jgi:hypothetical protein
MCLAMYRYGLTLSHLDADVMSRIFGTIREFPNVTLGSNPDFSRGLMAAVGGRLAGPQKRVSRGAVHRPS